MESMTSPNNEPPRHSREYDLGNGGDEHNPSTGPIPAAEPNDAPAGPAGETETLPPLLNEAADLSDSTRGLQPVEREALGASSAQSDASPGEHDRAAPIDPALPEGGPPGPIWPAARLGESFAPHAEEPAPQPAAAPDDSWEPVAAPQSEVAAPPAPPTPQRESTWRPAAEQNTRQSRPPTPPAPGGYPQQQPPQAPFPPVPPQSGHMGSAPAASAGIPTFGAPTPNAGPGYQSGPAHPNSVGAPPMWGAGGQPPQQQRFASDPYAPSISPPAPAPVPPTPTSAPQPGARAAAVSAQRRASVVESLTQLDSAPGRTRMSEAQWSEELARVKRPTPEKGWRAALYKGTFHLINPGRSKKEKDMADWVATIQSPLRGRYRVGVINARGGIGKTTVATGTASGFAAHRKEDRTIVVDADPGYGTAADRIDPTASGSLLTVLDSGNRGMLASDDQIRAHVGANSLGLMVLAGDSRLTNRPQLSPEIYRQAMPHVERFHRVIFVDCGPAIDHPVMPEVLANVDALIVVSSTKADGAKGAGVTLDWLSENNYHDLLKRTIVVINDLKGNSAKKLQKKLQERFGDVVDDVFVVPFDKHLDEATVIDFNNGLKSKTGRKFVEIAAAIANNFASTTDLSHD